MSAATLRMPMRRWLVVLALLLTAAPAFANSITIGSITYLGQGTPTDPHKAVFQLHLNTAGMIFDSHIPGMQEPLFFEVTVYGWDAGVFSTLPEMDATLRPPHFCPCEGANFNLSLLYPGPFKLANGTMFYPQSSITVTFLPPPGQSYLQYGQSMDIVLNSVPSPVPEPTTMMLIGSGLLALRAAGGRAWRVRQGSKRIT